MPHNGYMNTTYKLFFKSALTEVWEQDAAYDAEVSDYYANGDGRRREDGGKGYTFPHCPHGMSRWTDYDNICGPCEDGLTVIQRAQSLARNRYREFRTRLDWVRTMPANLPDDLRRSLVDWVCESEV